MSAQCLPTRTSSCYELKRSLPLLNGRLRRQVFEVSDVEELKDFFHSRPGFEARPMALGHKHRRRIQLAKPLPARDARW